MDLRPRWIEAIESRRSWRTYTDEPITDEQEETLETLRDSFRPFPSARFEVVREAPADLFTGLVGSYGRVASPSALVFIGEEDAPGARVSVGYVGEAAILEATAMGLATCWIGGGLDRGVAAGVAELRDGERVYSVAALGHAADKERLIARGMRAAARADTRKDVSRIAEGGVDDWPKWAIRGLEALRRSPSASNRQPWRVRLEGAHGDVRSDATAAIIGYGGVDTPLISKRLDCGIAMLHFELGALAAGAEGEWEILPEGSDVARWRKRG